MIDNIDRKIIKGVPSLSCISWTIVEYNLQYRIKVFPIKLNAFDVPSTLLPSVQMYGLYKLRFKDSFKWFTI